MEMWIPLLSEYGFPVMITLYLLHRIEKKLDLLNDSMIQLVVNVKGSPFSESKVKIK
ncbi:YvrJ family protein [Bacillaceae bacterium IKA-2]|nr:YvrJ family protein [Bacillaceae bacterium IKA-2]